MQCILYTGPDFCTYRFADSSTMIPTSFQSAMTHPIRFDPAWRQATTCAAFSDVKHWRWFSHPDYPKMSEVFCCHWACSCFATSLCVCWSLVNVLSDGVFVVVAGFSTMFICQSPSGPSSFYSRIGVAECAGPRCIRRCHCCCWDWWDR